MRRFRSASSLVATVVCAAVFLCSGCSQPYKPPGKELPEGFLIACYPKTTCTQSDSTPLPGKQKQQIIVLMSEDDVSQIVAWYKTELTLKAYQVVSDNEVKGTVTLEAQNDKMHVQVTISPLGDKHTIISISTYPKPI
ncbi:MAG: hypothetical protein JSS86_07670 [Cyanobacteria bacterium SZAS LIN-2]|nr:hypothetical protein [Cyanobacteria bacterium SZAS LIN-2]